jgi:glutamate 5-kinase
VPRAEWLAQLASDIFALRQRGQQVILVSSGAVALGRAPLGNLTRLDQKQAAAAIGQPRLIDAISSACAPHDITVAQALLTLEDTENRRRWLNARATLETLLDAGCLPVINENDTVATDEIRYGDNDRLAARVAQMMAADALVLLSDVDGLYTADPGSDSAATHIPHLKHLSSEHDDMASGANLSAGVGSGGMVTKLAAARIAYAAGCATYITLGNRDHPLLSIEQGERATLIEPSLSPAKARQIWLQSHINPEGTLHIDAGASKALQTGASLLAVGVTSADGSFERGAAVEIRGPEGNLIAKGITAYSAEDIRRIAGLKSNAIEARLGAPGRPAIIHRDDLVRV